MDRGRDQRQHRWGDSTNRELQIAHGLSDPCNSTGDHRVGAATVTTHADRVVDRRPNAGVLQRDGRMPPLVHQGGWA
jgi:hypothetical protein